MSSPRPLPHRPRLEVSVALGALLGATYTAVDVYLDHHLGAPNSTPTTVVEFFHSVIDLVLPMVCGALLGVATHALRLRERLATLERERADALMRRLGKIERDQAVWVISASLLHDLKTPLHALGLLLDELLELPDPLSDDQTELLQRARVQSERLEGKVQTLRSLPTGRRLELPSVELGELVFGLCEPLRAVADRRGAELVVRGRGPAVRAHQAYVRIILENLVDNALDALDSRGPGGHIWIDTRVEDGRAVVEVRDDGPGIDPVARSDLFEPLHTQKSRGLGLGLSTSRQLARAMGGELVLQAAEPGACFQLSLPVMAP